jgi:hypothetical protein
MPDNENVAPPSKPALPKYGRRPQHEWQTSNLAIEQAHQSLGRLLLLKANVVRAAVSRCPRTTKAIPGELLQLLKAPAETPPHAGSRRWVRNRLVGQAWLGAQSPWLAHNKTLPARFTSSPRTY